MTAEELRQMVGRLGDPQQRLVFFEGLNNPKLFDMLKNIGQFATPPAPTSSGDRVIHPVWPQARYLINVAPNIPNKVADLLRNVETDNQSVVADLARAVAKMPAGVSRTMTKPLRAWFESAGNDMTAYTYAEIIEALAIAGFDAPAFKVATTIFAVVPGKEIGIESLNWRKVDAVGKISEHQYPVLLERVLAALSARDAIKAIGLLAWLLNEALKIESRPGDKFDYSSIWAAKLEKNPIGRGVKESLVYRLFATAQSAVADGRVKLPEVIQSLARFEYDAYRRMRIALICDFGTEAEVQAEIDQADFFDYSEIRRERESLLEKHYSKLGKDAQRDIVCRMRESVIDDATARGFLSDRYSGDVLEQKVEEVKCHELFEALQPIAQHLIGSDAEEFADLKRRFETEDVEPESGEVWVGPTAPKSLEEFERMTTSEILDFLESWIPRRGFFQHSPEGLGRMLKPLIVRRSGEFLQQADRIVRLPPVYVRHIVDALRPEAAAGRVDIDRYIDLLDYARLRESDAAAGAFTKWDSFDDEPSWSPTRQIIAFAISDMCRARTIPDRLSKRVWAILEAISNDADPTAEDEAEHGIRAPWNRALNSTRGAAMLAAFDFARWTFVKAGGEGAKADLATSAPEVTALLDRRLDPLVDRTSAVRSTYGQNFVSIFAMSRSWTKSALSRIFSSDLLGEAAWNAYLVFNSVYEETFEVLKGFYAGAVDHLSSLPPAAKGEHDPAGSLGVHLVKMYGRGVLDLEDSGLVARFFANAPPTAAESALQSLGSAMASSERLPPDVVRRLESLYDYVLELYAGRPLADRRETLEPFGLWLLGPNVEWSWALPRLIRTLELTEGVVAVEFRVLESLAVASAEHPELCVQALDEMLRNSVQFSFFNSGAVRTILTAAVAAGGSIQERAVRANDKLANNGILTYNDVFE